MKNQSKSNSVNDLWNEDENKWLQGQNIHEQLICKRNWISEYNQIKNSIPEEWLAILKEENVRIEEHGVDHFEKIHLLQINQE